MKLLLSLMLVLAPMVAIADTGQQKTFKEVEGLALSGDYQAQRDLAYGYSSWPYPRLGKRRVRRWPVPGAS